MNFGFSYDDFFRKAEQESMGVLCPQNPALAGEGGLESGRKYGSMRVWKSGVDLHKKNVPRMAGRLIYIEP